MSNQISNQKCISIIVAIYIPPLAVYMTQGATNQVWINVLLCFLFYLPGVIHALYIVLSDERKQEIMVVNVQNGGQV